MRLLLPPRDAGPQRQGSSYEGAVGQIDQRILQQNLAIKIGAAHERAQGGRAEPALGRENRHKKQGTQKLVPRNRTETREQNSASRGIAQRRIARHGDSSAGRPKAEHDNTSSVQCCRLWALLAARARYSCGLPAPAYPALQGDAWTPLGMKNVAQAGWRDSAKMRCMPNFKLHCVID